jgi:hypothetical protein
MVRPGKRKLRGLAQLRAQCLECRDRRELAARGVDHPNLHFEMRGHRRWSETPAGGASRADRGASREAHR